MYEFRMPSLGADMEWGIVSQWYVGPGDRVERGEIVGVVETRKGAIEVEIFESGVVEEILVDEGTKVPVGEVLARLRTDEEARPTEPEAAPEAAPREGAGEELRPELETRASVAPKAAAGETPERPPEAGSAQPGEPGARMKASPAARKRAAELGLALEAIEGHGPDGAVTLADVEKHAARTGREAAAKEAPAVEPAPGVEGPPPEEPHRVSPLARKRAAELGLDLDRIEGTGPGGRVTRADVEAAAPAGAGAPEAGAVAPARERAVRELGSLREAIADAMARSKREIPHYYLGTRIDMRAASRWIEEQNRERSTAERILPAALLLKATALAARDVPELNGFWREGRLETSERVHLGVGISLRGGGLVAPALHDVDRKSVDAVSKALVDLVNRARSGRLRSSEVTDATLTVTNLGERGVESVYGIIYPPQVALVGFGRIDEEPWAEDGMLDVRPVVRATLAADHRASDGHQGGLFLEELSHRLRHPEELS